MTNHTPDGSTTVHSAKLNASQRNYAKRICSQTIGQIDFLVSQSPSPLYPREERLLLEMKETLLGMLDHWTPAPPGNCQSEVR